MRKSFFTFMLAIVSSVWMTSKATCLTQAPNELYWSYITVSGTIQWLDSPCEEGEECPPCVTPAIVTSDKTYYLSSSNQEVRDFLDRIESAPIPAIYLWPLKARASGTPYTQGSFDFLVVSNIDDLYVQYFSDQLTRIPSLCDEWNVWHESFVSFGPISFDKVVKYQLTTDTIIADSNYYSNYYTLQRYKRLEQDGQYMGAMREGDNRDIYYVPAGSTHEYLLYAFNVQVGEVLNDLYLGGFEENGYSGRVEAISDSSPRLFTIRVLYPTGMGVEPGESFSVTWIEGVGSPETPYGLAVVPTVPADIGVYTLLCAYKNGEQVYTSTMGAEYGCEHDQRPEPTDTIPLFSYIGDDPGSSTVDPVDPNQVVVTLKGDVLTVKETSGEEITLELSLTDNRNQMPALKRIPETETFRNEVTITLTEEGIYTLVLTNPSWGYHIYGTFDYPQRKDAIDQDIAPTPGAEKIIRNGQLLIRKGEKVYTVQGTAINE